MIIREDGKNSERVGRKGETKHSYLKVIGLSVLQNPDTTIIHNIISYTV